MILSALWDQAVQEKTTLLNCIATIDKVSAGHVYLEEKEVSDISSRKEIARFRRKTLGFVFQDFNLLDTLTIEENIALGPVMQGRSPQEVDCTVQDIASKLGITDILGKFPNQVSGAEAAGGMRACDGCKSQTDSGRRTDRRTGFTLFQTAAELNGAPES